MREVLIPLHVAAPHKPELGAACNGCGVCCLIDTCPAGRLRFWQIKGPCPALLWQADQGRYLCGLVQTPELHLGRWAAVWRTPLQRLFRRWIAAGQGCDCDARTDA